MTTPVSTTPLSPGFSVCGQIALTDIPELARQGFRSIINNRPDGEGGPMQPSSAEVEAAARAQGMAYVYFPVATLSLTGTQVAQYQQLCADLPRPVLAFCRSGGRSSALFQACGGQVGRG